MKEGRLLPPDLHNFPLTIQHVRRRSEYRERHSRFDEEGSTAERDVPFVMESLGQTRHEVLSLSTERLLGLTFETQRRTYRMQK